MHHAAWTVAAQAFSLGVGLLAMRILLHSLGPARLGVFTLALGLSGFSGLFDLGLGRALTQTVSSGLGAGHGRERVAAVVWRVLPLLAGLGGIWLFLLWYSAPWLVTRVFDLRGTLSRESLFGLRAMALSMPFALVATAALGSLEGLQQFRLLSLWRMPMSVVQFGLPAATALVKPDVGWVIAALASTRACWCLLWVGQLARLLPLIRGKAVSSGELRRTLWFGGWLSVSNLVSPLMVYADRFYLASVLPTAQIAYYTVTFDASARLASLPQVATNVLFPALAQARVNPGESQRLLSVAIRVLIACGLPATLALAVAAHPLLSWWLTPAFAQQASCVLQWILVGVLVNSVAHVPYALLQAHGRADLTAKLHLLELPVFAAALVWAVRHWGIEGAAVAWVMRVTLDATLLFGVAWQLHGDLRERLRSGFVWVFGAATTYFLVAFGLPPWLQGLAIAAITCVGLASALGALRGMTSGGVER
jgi:O-antigen/teichoic acid export membrane protein